MSMAKEFLQHIPAFILWACGALTFASIAVGLRLWSHVRRIRNQMWQVNASVGGAEPLKPEDRVHGLSGPQMEELRSRCRALSGVPGEWWHHVDSSLELYTSPQDRDGWFVTRPVREILPYEQAVAGQFNVTFYNAFPTLLTGVGLLLTFTAILMALSGVHYDKSNSVQPITGIDQLINGLSGKFLSSVVALSLGVI